MLIEQREHDERQKHHPQHRELVGDVQKTPHQSHVPPLRERARWPVRNRSDSTPVLVANRSANDGIPGADVSSSIRSTRCIGKNTRPGSTASPPCNCEAESSKQSRSSPRMVSPAGASSTIAPQNFSRGLFSVTSTTVPTPNPFRCSLCT